LTDGLSLELVPDGKGSERMLTVEHYELIRRKVLNEGQSQRQVARELGHSRKTIAKALALRIPPGYRLTEPRRRPVIEPFTHIIDAWLEQNKKARRKQKLTAVGIHERLRDEYGFTGHYGTVQRYIKDATNRQKEVFMPLQFEPGEEAQVDWHEGYIIDNGLERKVQFFVMKMCFSKAPFVYPYQRANLESFLDGHVRAFEYFGGVPQRIAYDNLRCAVIRVGKGKNRRLNQRFKELKAWYLFETRFCNIAKGNEKGDVENLCKRSERTYLAPQPQVDGIDQLASKLFDECQNDLNRKGPDVHGGKTVGELLAEEKPCLLPLESERFEACRRRSTFVDSHSLVREDNVRYSVPVQWAYHPCVIRIFVDKVEILCEKQVVAVHKRCYIPGQYVIEPCHYLKLLQRKPGSIDNARPFKGQPWGEDFDFMRKELEYRYKDDGTKRDIKILMLFTEYSEDQVKAAVSICVKRRAFSEDAVLNVIHNEPLTERGKLDLSDRPELINQGDGIRDTGIYDQLKSSKEVLV
jgi:transposase